MPTRRNKLYLNSKTPILLACTRYNKASLINKQCRIQVDADNADDDVYTANESSPCRRLTLPWPLPCLDWFQNRISWSLYGMVTPFKSYKHWTTRSWDLALTRISDWRTDNPERTQRRSIRYSPVHTAPTDADRVKRPVWQHQTYVSAYPGLEVGKKFQYATYYSYSIMHIGVCIGRYR